MFQNIKRDSDCGIFVYKSFRCWLSIVLYVGLSLQRNAVVLPNLIIRLFDISSFI